VKPLAILFCFLLSVSVSYAQETEFTTVKRTVTLMGSSFEITIVAQNEELGYINIEEAVAEIRRLEKMISSWDPDSETSQINKNAGIKPI
jgi:thiamine biosynthesis lipoprotein